MYVSLQRAALLLLLPALASAQKLRQSSSPPTRWDGLVVEVQPGSSIASVLQGTGLRMVASIAGTSTYLVRAQAGTPRGALVPLLRQLRSNPGARYAAPNALGSSPESNSCRPGPRPTAQPCTVAFVDGTPTLAEYTGQPAVTNVQAAQAAALSGARSSIVAVIDTGIDPTHSVFQGRLLSLGYDFIEDRPGAIDIADGKDTNGNGSVDEAFGHGTHIAGTIALINPYAKILPYRVLDSDGIGSAFQVACAIHAAVDTGCDVINLSLSMTTRSRVVHEAIDRAEEAGIVVVSSAGNTGGKGVTFPASLNDVVAVAAVDDADLRAPFSAFGLRVGLSAPGVGIYSAFPGERWARWSGTSMASAVASGVVSLTTSSVPTLLPDPKEPTLEATVSLSSANPLLVGLLGTGRVDAYEAVQEALQQN